MKLLLILLFLPIQLFSQTATIKLADGTFINNAPSNKDWSNYDAIGFDIIYTEYQVVIDENNPVTIDGITILASGYQNQPPDNVYPPKQIFDNDLSTKWAAKGFGHWVQFSLPEMRILESIDVAFTVGDRNDIFDLFVSIDSINWITVLDKQIGVLGTGFTNYDFVDIQAKHIKYVAQGNVQSSYDWNSIAEINFNFEVSELPCIDTVYFDSVRWTTEINWIDSINWIEKDTTIIHYKDSTIIHYDTLKSRIDTVFILPKKITFELN